MAYLCRVIVIAPRLQKFKFLAGNSLVLFWPSGPLLVHLSTTFLGPRALKGKPQTLATRRTAWVFPCYTQTCSCPLLV